MEVLWRSFLNAGCEGFNSIEPKDYGLGWTGAEGSIFVGQYNECVDAGTRNELGNLGSNSGWS